MDPVYKLFLDHVTPHPHGTSYVLQIDDPLLGGPLYLKYEGEDDDDKTTTTTTSRRPKPKAKSSSVKKSKRRASTSPSPPPLVEESYDRFLKHLNFQQGLMILDLQGGRSVVYEHEEEQHSTIDDARALVPHAHASCSNYQGEENQLAVVLADVQSFDEKLAAVVNEPFDQREYEALMNEALRRKPVIKHRNLRNKSKGYHTYDVGKSYLDYYPGKCSIQFYQD